jgi:uncharacterized sporulation protein YeaH/YhbH (DUF444 family)
VWLALRVRRDALVSFLAGLVEEFEEAMFNPTKRREYATDASELVEFFEVSPTYEALLRGEMRQQEMVDEMLAKKQKEEQGQDKGQGQGKGKGKGEEDAAAAALSKLSL